MSKKTSTKNSGGQFKAFAKYSADCTRAGIYLMPQINGKYMMVAEIKIPPCQDAGVPSGFVHTVVEAYNKMLKNSML